MRPGQPLLGRTLLILLLAVGGVLLGAQSRFFVARLGWTAYVTLLLLVGLGLAAMARRPRRG